MTDVQKPSAACGVSQRDTPHRNKSLAGFSICPAGSIYPTGSICTAVQAGVPRKQGFISYRISAMAEIYRNLPQRQIISSLREANISIKNRLISFISRFLFINANIVWRLTNELSLRTSPVTPALFPSLSVFRGDRRLYFGKNL